MGAYIYIWDPVNEVWRKAAVNVSGALIIATL